ncbi:MAG TPA: sugar ABC transporter permease [Thermomicrobiales bacterium]|nr:sugar ABC transporter permease [Thermomicrobiales bacterium]
MADIPIPAVETSTRKARFRGESLLPKLLLSPSLLAIIVFVYGFIGMTIWVSFSNWRSASMDLSLADDPFETYRRLFTMTRFQTDLRNSLVFTVLFLVFSVLIGLALALLLDQSVFGRSVFRNIFLFPYALSFIVTGIAWRWVFNPETGINLLLDSLGLNWLLGKLGVPEFWPPWLTTPDVVGDLGVWIPGLDGVRTQLGLPLAMIPVVIAAVWQLSGFAMAMYLAGLGTISHEIREAAQLDGASRWRIYRDIIIPILRPITVSILIILGHVSLKIFDLIYAMSGSGPGFATDVPGIFVYEQTFRATRYNLGAAASIVMLIMVSIVIVPYLARNLKEL